VTVALDATYELSPQVALRSEPFGALAYHYGNRRLVFVRRPELVALLEALHHHPSLAGALTASGIVERRWPSFVKALSDLESSEIIRAREA
jgi:putative mycofactocin binding protein MftB